MTPRLPPDPSDPALRRALPLACAAVLSACASLAPPASPALPDSLLPATWSASASSASPENRTALAAWWQRFDDPALTALVTQALQANTSVKSAQAALRQARALADVQRAGLGPTLGASASAQRSRSGNSDASNRFQAGFDASWEPDIFGGNRSAADASEADAQASAASLANVQVSLAAEVAASYINLRGLQTRLAIARSNLATQTETLQITRWRAQAGLVSSLDVEQAVSAAEQTRAQIPALQTSVAQALNALAVLTGQAPGALNATLGAAAPIPPAPGRSGAGLSRRHAAPAARRARRRAARARRRSRAWRWPMPRATPAFSLSGSLGLSALTLGTLDQRRVAADLAAGQRVGAAVRRRRWPRRRCARRKPRWSRRARATEAAVLAALQDVEDALVALRGDRERLARLQAAATAAANAELLARQRYNSGLIDFATVLSTQRSLLSAQDSVASAQASLSADHVRLYKALGGGWTARRRRRGDANAAPAAPDAAQR